MKLVALLISITDDRNGLLLIESVVFQQVGWKYGENISGLAGTRYPVVCALRNDTLGLIPVSGSKRLWSPEPDSVVSQVTLALGGVSRRRVGWGPIKLPQLVQTVCLVNNVHTQWGSAGWSSHAPLWGRQEGSSFCPPTCIFAEPTAFIKKNPVHASLHEPGHSATEKQARYKMEYSLEYNHNWGEEKLFDL